MAAALFIRLTPYLLSGVPYTTDTWPTIQNAQALLASTPVMLAPGRGFDSYNIFWPGLILFSGMLSVIAGVKLMVLMPVATPLVNSLSFLVFYVLVRRLGLGRRPSFIAALLAGVALGSGIVGAGVTKESFAVPLMFTFLLLLVEALESNRASLFGCSALTFAAILLSHHLTSVMTLLVSLYLLTYFALFRRASPGLTKGVALALAMTGMSLYYFFSYASPVTLFTISDSVVLSAAAYELVFLLPVALGLTLTKKARLARGWSAAALLSVAAVAVGTSRVAVTADAPLVTVPLLLDFLPYAVVVLLAVFTVLRAPVSRLRSGLAFFAFWSLGLLGIVFFSAFGTPGVIETTLRIADFAYPAIAVLGALALSSAMKGRAGAVAGGAVVALFVVASAGGVVWTAYYSGALGGSQRVYLPSDVSTVAWVASHWPESSALHGDLRYQYLFSVHPNISLDVPGGFTFLTQQSKAQSGCLLLSSLVSQIGYIGYDYGIPVAKTAVASVGDRSGVSTVYDSGQDFMYCKTG